MNNKSLINTYLFFIHLVLIFFITYFSIHVYRQPHKISTWYYNTLLAFQLRIDANTPPGATIFIGDSHIQGLSVSAVAPRAINFGIGKDTLDGVLNRIKLYKSLRAAKAVVLEIGINDLRKRNTAKIGKGYDQILSALPGNTPILLCALLPIDERRTKRTSNTHIVAVNQEIEKACSAYSNCNFLDIADKLTDTSNNLSNNYHIGDGTHLNPQGYEIWITELQKSLRSIDENFTG